MCRTILLLCLSHLGLALLTAKNPVSCSSLAHGKGAVARRASSLFLRCAQPRRHTTPSRRQPRSPAPSSWHPARSALATGQAHAARGCPGERGAHSHPFRHAPLHRPASRTQTLASQVPFEVVYVSSDRDAEQKARLRTAQPHGACHRNFKNTFSRLSEGAALHGRFP